MKLNLQLFAVPARRTSKTAKRARRTHLKKDAPTITTCKNCGEALSPHRACTKCGFYKGDKVITVKKDKEKETENESK